MKYPVELNITNGSEYLTPWPQLSPRGQTGQHLGRCPSAASDWTAAPHPGTHLCLSSVADPLRAENKRHVLHLHRRQKRTPMQHLHSCGSHIHRMNQTNLLSAARCGFTGCEYWLIPIGFIFLFIIEQTNSVCFDFLLLLDIGRWVVFRKEAVFIQRGLCLPAGQNVNAAEKTEPPGRLLFTLTDVCRGRRWERLRGLLRWRLFFWLLQQGGRLRGLRIQVLYVNFIPVSV